ncbi:MAG: RidA family protein [Actinomycetota bacterium]
MRQNIRSGGPFEETYGYCRAVRVGNTVHVAGTCAQEPNIDGCDAGQQAAAALDIITAALAEAGATPADVVRTVTYVTDIDDLDLVATAHRAVFGEVWPASTLVEVSRLVDPRLKVEIEAYAIIDEG